MLQQIKFEKYFALLKAITADISCASVMDSRLDLVWSECDTEENRKILTDFIKNHFQVFESKNSIDFSSHQLTENRIILSIFFEDEIHDNSLYLIVLMHTEKQLTEDSIHKLYQQLSALGNCIITERDLTHELETMADELASRYDELNLIYQSEKNASTGPYHTQALLQHLVLECQEYLAAGIVALVLPCKNISIFEYNPDGSVKGSPELFHVLKSELFEKLVYEQSSLVINNHTDSLRYNLLLETLPYKFLVNPVESESGAVIGLLAMVNSLQSNDFRNSDKNLLGVIARKVTKVIVNNFDNLTGLMNQNSFEMNVQDLLNNVYRTDTEHAVLNIDIDQLNVINDISGREAGDAVIRLIGQAITPMVRSRDSVARLSGDRFGVTLESCSLQTAEDMANRIIDVVNKLKFQWSGVQYDLSVCIGVAPITVQNDSFALTLSSVEAACNSAKERGKGSVQVFHQDSHELQKLKGEMIWVEKIQSAIRNDKFVVYAQLINGLGKNHNDRHYEVLLRLIDEKGDIISPFQFLPAAEHYKLMPDIDRWVINNVFTQILEYIEQNGNFPFKLSVNLSGQSLGNKKCVIFLSEQIARLGNYAANICFEITETAVISNIEEAQSLMAKVKKMGCTFSLDDFGTGLSSFSYLKNLDVDYIKIDGSFVREIDVDPVSESMVSSINQIGHIMKLKTIAEYVENEAILSRLKKMEVDFAQGYVYGRPKPLKSLLDNERTQFKGDENNNA